MTTSRPLDVAFVWHMHQPYYRSAGTGTFKMPWARMHALKDYLDMVQILASYPTLHQTFNLVPSLVEQLETYASGAYDDLYWTHTVKPAAELEPAERAFVLERLCEHADHPRARSHARYLELARKRDSLAAEGWEQAGQAFSVQELLDLQIWFNLAWFGAGGRSDPAISELLERGQGFTEQDKVVLAACQERVLGEILPAYRESAARGQVELTTSPYYHPILPLLCDTDSARIATADLRLPARRFAHPEDASQQLADAVSRHAQWFGDRPRGVWCSEMAVGESVIPLLADLGIDWTIGDEGVLSRSVAEVTIDRDVTPRSGFGTPYRSYRLVREGAELAMVFRDHTVSDLIGFTYRSWDSREAASDLLRRLREIQQSGQPLVVIALDGENAWEYYQNGAVDFLSHLYEGLSTDTSLRCVTVSEHLRESPPESSLEWLHTGSWVFSDLTTWCGTDAQNEAWEHLHRARDLADSHRRSLRLDADHPAPVSEALTQDSAELAWRQVLIAEGSDWFWWFGDHHHTQLDAVWDHEFRLCLQEVYRLLAQPVPAALSRPLAHLQTSGSSSSAMPLGPIDPQIDGLLSSPTEWEAAGKLRAVTTPAMHAWVDAQAREVRFGWRDERLCLMVAVEPSVLRPGITVEATVRSGGNSEEMLLRATLQEGGCASIDAFGFESPAEAVMVSWRDVVEISLPSPPSLSPYDNRVGLVVRIGMGGPSTKEFCY